MDALRMGRYIAETRKSCKMTQEQLAQKLHVTEQAVSRWERGKGLPDISLLEPLAEVLGVRIDELINAQNLDTR